MDREISKKAKRKWAKEEHKEERKKDKLRSQMVFYRSSWLACYEHDIDFPDAIDRTVESLLALLIGENLCLMALESVTVTPFVRENYPLDSPARTMRVVTITAKPMGIPQLTPMSRASRERIDKQEEEKAARIAKMREEATK